MPVALFANALAAGDGSHRHALRAPAQAQVVLERQLQPDARSPRATRPARCSRSSAMHLDHLLKNVRDRGPADRLRPPGRPRALRPSAAADVRRVVAGDRPRARRPQRLPPAGGATRRPHRLPREGRSRVPAGGGGVDAEQVPPRGADAAVQRVLEDAPARRRSHRRLLRRRHPFPRRHRARNAGELGIRDDDLVRCRYTAVHLPAPEPVSNRTARVLRSMPVGTVSGPYSSRPPRRQPAAAGASGSATGRGRPPPSRRRVRRCWRATRP